MRFPLAGLILLLVAAAALGQAEGEVEAIGFGGMYRPNCWLPMKLKLRPKTGAAQTYTLQVVQEDLDRDRVSYTRPFTLTGNPEGRTIEERVWVYCLPQPRLLNQAQPQELNSILKVFLCTESGKQLAQIPLQQGMSITSLDEAGAFGSTLANAKRLVLVVAGVGAQPIHSVYSGARGVNEHLHFVRISPNDLPGNVIGYDAVDCVLWLNADPGALDPDALAALQEYIRDGGRMLVCPNAEWQRLKESELGAMLPVEMMGMEQETGPLSLRKLAGMPIFEDPKEVEAGRRDKPQWFGGLGGEPLDPWPDLKGRSLPIARALPRNGALVEMNSVSDPTRPYLVRWMVGQGMVSWIAQDLGSPALQSRQLHGSLGWTRIWDRAFGFPNDTITSARTDKTDVKWYNAEIEKTWKETYADTMTRVDLSTALGSLMEHGRTGAALVALAILFFVIYWLVAGPGVYFFLLARKQAQYSWLGFGLCGIAATGVTALLVKAVLRGPPEIRHATFVRLSPDGQAVARSRLGLYIPRDGMQDIELKETAPKRQSFITPYPEHPIHLKETGSYPAPLEYEVPVRERNSSAPAAIRVPYRSTLKKFQAKWVGQLSGGIEGALHMDGNNPAGKLLNNTGHDLHAVYMLYRPTADISASPEEDFLLYFPDGPKDEPAWPNGKTLDLILVRNLALVNRSSATWRRRESSEKDKAHLGVRGALKIWAADVWGGDFRQRNDSFHSDANSAALLLSIFDRLAPAKAVQETGVVNWSASRYELLRLAARNLDASSAVACGQMLIIARSAPASPLPFPLYVEGDRINGSGVVYYQFILPIDRPPPTTQPADTPVEQEKTPPQQATR